MSQYVYRDDNVPGYIYLIESIGFHGIIPGKFPGIKRCKIGLTRSLEMRLDGLESSQPPCNYVILKSIYVSDMKLVETKLHREFKSLNVKLKKSREWFDLDPLQMVKVKWAMDRHNRSYGLVDAKSRIIAFNIKSTRFLMIAALALFGILALGSVAGIRFDTPNQSDYQELPQ